MITSPSNSSVSLLGVDQSVTLLGSGNDITQDRIDADLNGYNVDENFPELNIQGNQNPYLDFGNSNVFVLTNAVDGEISCSHVRSETNPVLNEIDHSGLVNTPTNQPRQDTTLIRKNFPETWIFEDFLIGENGTHTQELTVPDTITSFIVTGFAIHPDTGLGIAIKQKVTVIQEFFIKLSLPYAIRAGEILRVDVSVFHYIQRLQQSQNVEVEMMNDDLSFEFIEAMFGRNYLCQKTSSYSKSKKKTTQIKFGTGSSVYFLIRSLVEGQIKIHVKASFLNYKDEIEKYLLVESEGLTHYKNDAKFFNLKGNSSDSYQFDLKIPEEAIKSSVKMETKVVGDLLGPVLSNVEDMM